MLRGEDKSGGMIVGLAWTAAIGALAAALVYLGNPGNMGICGACFLRDWAGSLGLIKGAGPAIFRPEVAGLMFGAFALRLITRQEFSRSGSYAATRFLFGVVMAFAALVFLGCPFRMLQRVGGGDLNAWIGLAGFIVGVRVGMLFEARGYSVGKTSVVAAPVGPFGMVAVAGLLALFLTGGYLLGPGPGDAGPPPHALWSYALGIAAVAGVALSATGFCAILAARQIFLPQKKMLLGAIVLIVAFGVVTAATGKFKFSLEGQPIAHQEWLWNLLAPALLGLTGVLAGGCPVRQIVMAGEGNGDAFVTVMGLLVGGALAHNFGAVSSPTGTTAPGHTAIIVGLVASLAYAAYTCFVAKKGVPA